MKKTLCFFGGYGPQYWLNIRTPDIDGKCDGITVCSLDDGGNLSRLTDIHGIDSPATLAVSPDGKYLYAADELNNFKGLGHGGGISAFSFGEENSELKLLNQVSAAGSCTAYIAIDKCGKYLFVANHGSYYYVSRYEIDDRGHVTPAVLRDEGCVCVYRILDDGSVGPLVDRLVLEGRGHDPIVHGVSHPHCIVIDENDDVVIPDKGGDQIYFCHFSRRNEKLAVRSVFNSGDGSSPRHAAFVKGTPYVAVTNEFDAHLTVYKIDRENGCLVLTDKVDTYDPEITQECDLIDTARPWAIDVKIHPNGKFVYVDNTQNIICLFYLNEHGKIELIENTPVKNAGMVRGMGISPDGRFLIITGVSGEKADVFAIDQHSGHLSHVSSIELPTPTAVAFKVYGGRDD